MKRKRVAYLAAMMVAWSMETRTDAQAVGTNMVLVPAGPFQMGDSFKESGRDFTIHSVNVSAFYIDKYEVTGKLWDEVYQWATNRGYSFSYAEAKSPTHPAHSMNWFDAIKWCNARSEKEGREPAYYIPSSFYTKVYRSGQISLSAFNVKWNSGYRLQTAAEWEKAARGGLSGKRFPWGDTISHNQANYESSTQYLYDISATRGYHPAFNDGVVPYTSPVGSFAPNDYGLYDMAGNVWEWCWDWDGTDYAHYFNYSDNPQGPDSGVWRVIRGGHWRHEAFGCRVSYHVGTSPRDGSSTVGFRCVLLPVVHEWQKAIEVQPVQPTYAPPPEKVSDKDSLVVVTHGWRPDLKWLEGMTNVITTYLTANGLKNWEVHGHKWVEKASQGGPRTALQNGKEEGVSLGRSIISQGFSHVHLIAHSAGATLIQSASEIIKKNPTKITVHLTFLDAFVGFKYEERGNYGKGADWADNYFSRDINTGGEFYQLTEGPLDHAYNVDVTWLDANKKSIQMYASTPLGEVSQTCYQTVTSHGWPYQFYTATVPPNTLLGSQGFGFPLSKEGGNWNTATNQYTVGANMLQVLGSGEMSCTPNPSRTQLQVELPRDFSKLPGASVIINAPEKVNIRGIDFTLKTASPAWLAATLPITNKVNLVSFEAVFTSTDEAEGLLSVYWETNVISSVDERVTTSGMHQYSFPIPETATNGIRALGFRLDAFSAIQSSVIITNVALGFAGMREPFSLSLTGVNPNGMPLLELMGPAGFNYTVETSTNLTDWATTALLINTNGMVRFIDPNTNNATARFYRAAAP